MQSQLNFTEEVNFIKLDLDLLKTNDFRVDGSGIFDLNNDGFLDIVAGYSSFGGGNSVNTGTNIFWGSDTFIYSYENSTKIHTTPWLNPPNGGSLFGVAFIDYDEDGLYDILTNGPASNFDDSVGMGYLTLHRNLGNNQFQDVTIQVMDNYYFVERKDHGDYQDMPIPYQMKILDVDEDGDFDIAPHGGIVGDFLGGEFFGEDAWENAAGPNQYWENIGGRFIYRHDKIELFTGCLNDLD